MTAILNPKSSDYHRFDAIVVFLILTQGIGLFFWYHVYFLPNYVFGEVYSSYTINQVITLRRGRVRFTSSAARVVWCVSTCDGTVTFVPSRDQ